MSLAHAAAVKSIKTAAVGNEGVETAGWTGNRIASPSTARWKCYQEFNELSKSIFLPSFLGWMLGLGEVRNIFVGPGVELESRYGGRATKLVRNPWLPFKRGLS